ncbi:hypothetical protein GCK72_024355 [Caenorhabditis remanei]|nr:hypothetical protein GCK72_024355 [Caenorhabditis remanei]KAF1747889.1 hypothetical protein GCK72_024355 [Caenorhabditis remanei]
MSSSHQEPRPVDVPLSKSSQASIHQLIERCIDSQRRLETAGQNLTDHMLRQRTASLLSDLRSYRRVLVENLTERFEPDIESIRIVEKALQFIASSTDEICLIAGKECTQQN